MISWLVTSWLRSRLKASHWRVWLGPIQGSNRSRSFGPLVITWFCSSFFTKQQCDWLGERLSRSGPWGHSWCSPRLPSPAVIFPGNSFILVNILVLSCELPTECNITQVCTFFRWILSSRVFAFSATAIFLTFCLLSPSPPFFFPEPQVHSQKNRMNLQWTDRGTKVF